MVLALTTVPLSINLAWIFLEELTGEQITTLRMTQSSLQLETLGLPDLFLPLKVPSFWYFMIALCTAVLLTFTVFTISCSEKFKLLKVTIWACFSMLSYVFVPIFSTCEFTWFWLKCVLASTFLNWKWKDVAIQRFNKNKIAQLCNVTQLCWLLIELWAFKAEFFGFVQGSLNFCPRVYLPQFQLQPPRRFHRVRWLYLEDYHRIQRWRVGADFENLVQEMSQQSVGRTFNLVNACLLPLPSISVHNDFTFYWRRCHSNLMQRGIQS